MNWLDAALAAAGALLLVIAIVCATLSIQPSIQLLGFLGGIMIVIAIMDGLRRWWRPRL